MISIWAVALLIVLASVAIGRATMLLLGWERPSWLGGAVGFAVLVILAPLLVRLPGRGLTAAILLAILTTVCMVVTRRATPERPAEPDPDKPRALHLAALFVVLAVLGLASLPFLFNEGTGVLGEGIYTNDHGAQLYWTDWLADGFGPEPSAVGFGYPTGPQAVAAAISEGTTIDLVAVFNGLLLAIPVLTALAALAALESLPPVRRVVAASLTGLPYLAASFLAQSAFKETVMALFVLALAVAWSRRDAAPRALAGVTVLFAAASVFAFSLPGLAWLGLALPLWLAIAYAAGDAEIDTGALRSWAGSNRGWLIAGGLVVAVAVAVGIGFLDKLDDVGLSQGRLSSPVFPGEAFGIWPEGDFRLVRGDVDWSLPATAFAALCLLGGAVALVRKREWGLLSVLLAAGAVYVLARLFSSIYVEAKALAIVAPLAMLVAVRWLLRPSEGPGAGQLFRQIAGVAFVVLALGSTLLALRAAPVGFDERQQDLERLGQQIEGEKVVFLGVDRFGAYYLRGTLVQSPGGYVPPEVKAQKRKVWQQGQALDFDTVEPRKLDDFDYAVTTAAAYQSTPPPNWTEVAREGDYVLWQRDGATPKQRVLGGEGGDAGRVLDCQGDRKASKYAKAGGTATVLGEPALIPYTDWKPSAAFEAPGSAEQAVQLDTAGDYELSLQYHSQVPLTVSVNGEEVADLPPTLEGIYLTSPGRGAFWPAGEFAGDEGSAAFEITAAKPSGLQDALGVGRKVWLGTLAATPAAAPEDVPIAGACGSYVDHFVLSR